VHISDFDYELPEELIAQHPLPKRDASRMLVVNRATGAFEDKHFVSLPDYLRPAIAWC
jgi:S-adenosylmethionine:tRNA ribosyltransferase-isomerase